MIRVNYYANPNKFPALVGVSRFAKEIPAYKGVREHQPNTVILLLVLFAWSGFLLTTNSVVPVRDDTHRGGERLRSSGRKHQQWLFVLLVLPGNIIKTIEILQRETPTMAVCNGSSRLGWCFPIY
jgi:hypothetical protein